MLKRAAVLAAVLAGASAATMPPSLAGDWNNRYVAGANVPWYDQPPLVGTGAGYYYRHHPDHIPAYPRPLTGYPVPIYEVGALPGPIIARRVVSDPHVDWCLDRYRSYDVGTDTYQPYHGPRRLCRSPFE